MIFVTTANITSAAETGGYSVRIEICTIIWASFPMSRVDDMEGESMSDFEKLINASDLIEWIMETYPDWCEGDVRGIVDHVEEIPSAQPEKEKAKRVLWTGWKGHRDTRYKCPNCKNL